MQASSFVNVGITIYFNLTLLDWRGSSTGGQIFGSNYRNFPRFKLIDFTRRHPGLVDAALTTWSDELCGAECDRETIMGEYDFTGQGAPREDEYGYKYLLDIDGNAFSGRFLGLLRSGSLVFKVSCRQSLL